MSRRVKKLDVVKPSMRDRHKSRPSKSLRDKMTRPLSHLPSDTNDDIGTLWRYMDWWKYEDVVQSGTLWMSTAVELDDREGQFLQYVVANDAVYRTQRTWDQYAR